MAGETLPPVIALFEGEAEDVFAVIDELEERLEALGELSADPNVDLATKDFDTKVSDVETSLVDLGAEHVDPSVGLSDSDFEAKVADVEATLVDLDAEQAHPRVGLETADFDAKLLTTTAALVDLDAEEADPSVGLTTVDFDAKIDTVESALADVDAEEVSPSVGLDTAQFDEQDDLVQAALEELRAERADPTVGIDDDEFLAKYAEVEADLAALDVQEVTIDTESAVQSLDNVGAAADRIGIDISQIGFTDTLAFDDVVTAAEGVGLEFADLDDAANQLGLNIDEAGITTKDAMNAIAIAAQNAGLAASLGIESMYVSLEGLGGAAADAEGALQDVESGFNDVEQSTAGADGAMGGFITTLAYIPAAALRDRRSAWGRSANRWHLAVALAAIPAVGALVGELGVLSAIGFTAFAGLGAVALAVVPVFMQVSTAYQQITKDQLAVTQASTAATKASTEAALTQYLASLNPMVASLTENVIKAKGAFENWDKQFDPEIIKLFNDGVSAFMALLPDLTPLVNDAADALDLILNNLHSDFSSPSFQQFVQWVATNTGPAITSLANFAEDVVQSLAEMGENGQPFITMIERGLDQFGQDLEKFGVSNTFKDFVNWLVTNGPIIGKDFEEIGKDVGKVIVAFAPFGQDVLGVITSFFNLVTPGLELLGKTLDNTRMYVDRWEQGWDKSWLTTKNEFDESLGGIKKGFDDMHRWLDEALDDVANVFAKGWGTAWGGIKSTFDGVWGIIKTGFSDVSNWLTSTLTGAAQRWEAGWDGAWGGIKSTFDTVWGAIKTGLGDIDKAITDTIEVPIYAAASVWDGAWKAFGAAVSTVWGVLKPIFDAIEKAIDDIVGAAGKIGGIIGDLGKVAGAATGALGAVGGVIGKGLSIIGLAEGGEVTSPTLAIVGEAGPELVIPKSQLGGALTGASGISPLPPIGQVSTGSNSGGGGVSFGDFHITINGTTNNNPQQLAEQVYEAFLVKARSLPVGPSKGGLFGGYGGSR